MASLFDAHAIGGMSLLGGASPPVPGAALCYVLRIMVRDVAFEASVLRGGLLLGLVHEREVPDWAMSVLGVSPSLDAGLAEVCLSPIELSTMRECLYPLTRGADVTRVAAALLTLCAVAPSTAGLSIQDRLQQLQLLRLEVPLSEDAAAGIRSFPERMFASPDVGPHGRPWVDELVKCLNQLRARGYFRLYFATREEAVAFMAALSRRIASDRCGDDDASGGYAPQGWLCEDTGVGLHVLLNEPAWVIAARAFAPLPVASRIPVDPPGDSDLPAYDLDAVARLAPVVS